MTTIRAIIIDDEEKSRKVLKTLLQKFYPEVIICGEAEDIEQGYKIINAEQPELVFLDIQMPNGNGFKLLRQFKEVFFEVIFVTGYDEYAMNAIKFNALDYLLKPIEVNDLLAAVKKAFVNKLKNEKNDIKIINLINTAESKDVDRKIVVHQNEKVILLSVSAIVFIEADDRYCKLHTKEKIIYTITRTLKEFEEYLAGNKSFIRTNKNIILNINYIENYSKGEPCFVELLTGEQFEVSRRKKQEFLERLKEGRGGKNI